MTRRTKDTDREDRIRDEAIVDAYGPDEQAMGWYYYLDNRLHFPFVSKCSTNRVISPLRVGERVQTVGMAPEKECGHDMLVMVEWRDTKLAVPLSQVSPVDADEDTTEAVEDWHYWVERGYGF